MLSQLIAQDKRDFYATLDDTSYTHALFPCFGSLGSFELIHNFHPESFVFERWMVVQPDFDCLDDFDANMLQTFLH